MNQEQFIKDLLSKISEMRKNNRHGDIRVYFQDGNINKISVNIREEIKATKEYKNE